MSHTASDWLITAAPLGVVAALLIVFVLWQPAPLRQLVERHPRGIDAVYRLVMLAIFAGLLVFGGRWSALPFLLFVLIGTPLGRVR